MMSQRKELTEEAFNKIFEGFVERAELGLARISPYDLRNRTKTMPIEDVISSWKRSIYYADADLQELCTVYDNKLLMHSRTPNKWSFFYNGLEGVEKQTKVYDTIPLRNSVGSFLSDSSVESMTIGAIPVFNMLKKPMGKTEATIFFYIPAELTGKEEHGIRLGEQFTLMLKNPLSFLVGNLEDPLDESALRVSLSEIELFEDRLAKIHLPGPDSGSEPAPSKSALADGKNDVPGKKAPQKLVHTEIVSGVLCDGRFTFGRLSVPSDVFAFDYGQPKAAAAALRRIIGFMVRNVSNYAEIRITENHVEHALLCIRRAGSKFFFIISVMGRSDRDTIEIVESITETVKRAWQRK